MVSDPPRISLALRTGAAQAEPDSAGLGERVVGRVREMLCAVHGHDNLLQFGHDRMFLKCVSCGHESPGWDIARARPMAQADPRRQPLVGPHYVDTRRIA